MLKFLIITAVSLATIAPTLARPQTEKKPQDPNRTICRSSDVTGSRLQVQKTCMTAMQWDQLEREQRMTVDKVQQFKPQISN